jgi:hypothetical protein
LPKGERLCFQHSGNITKHLPVYLCTLYFIFSCSGWGCKKTIRILSLPPTIFCHVSFFIKKKEEKNLPPQDNFLLLSIT